MWFDQRAGVGGAISVIRVELHSHMAFALTHAYKDHCLGFADLLSKVRIDELWATPRLWREYNDPGARCMSIRPNGRAFVAHTAADCDNVRRTRIISQISRIGGRSEEPADGLL